MKLAIDSLEKISQNYSKLLFLGAGKHCLNLLEEINIRREINDKIPRPSFVVDDNSQTIEQVREYFNNKENSLLSSSQVISSKHAEDLDFDAIILATDSWQKELTVRAKEIWPEHDAIFNLYT